MSRVAYCPKCYRIVLADEVTGFDTCPGCSEKYKFTDINQHSWYLMTAEEKARYKAKWFGSAHVANDTVRSFNEETGQEKPVKRPGEDEVEEDATPIAEVTFPMTKSDTFEGMRIIEYLGVVSGSYVLSTTTLANIEKARQLSMDEMRRKCNALGANAAVSVSIDTQISDSLVIFTTSATAVRI